MATTNPSSDRWYQANMAIVCLKDYQEYLLSGISNYLVHLHVKYLEIHLQENNNRQEAP